MSKEEASWEDLARFRETFGNLVDKVLEGGTLSCPSHKRSHLDRSNYLMGLRDNT